MLRTFSIGIAVILSGTVALAQQLPVPDAAGQALPPSTRSADQQKSQVRSFAAVLRAAVEVGGQRLQKRVAEEVPTAPSLAMAGEPDVLGMPHPDGGFVFTVQVPDILPSFFPILAWQQRQQRAGVAGSARPVTTDPVDKPVPVVPDKSAFDPDQEYSDFVREGLIEAMIENSQALGIAETGQLVIVASVTAAVRRNPLDTSRLLILSIKSEDLAAYRQGRITKDEVKLRITDRRF